MLDSRKGFIGEVQRVPEKNCFVSLPAQIVDALARDYSKLIATLELKWSASLQREGVAAGRETQDGPGHGTRSVLVSWSGGSSLAHDRLEVPASLAECLGLPDGMRVDAQIRRDIESATRIDVEPVAHDDWEIIELHAEHLEEQLLNQVHPLRFKIGSGMVLDFLTANILCLITGPSCNCWPGAASVDPNDHACSYCHHCGVVFRKGCRVGTATERRRGGRRAQGSAEGARIGRQNRRWRAAGAVAAINLPASGVHQPPCCGDGDARGAMHRLRCARDG